VDRYELIITDVTCYDTLYCVAGWDVGRKCMIRPEPPDMQINREASRFWGEAWVGPNKFFAVGHQVRFHAYPPPCDSPPPHVREDRVFQRSGSTVVRKHSVADTARMVAGGVSFELANTFGGLLRRSSSGKAYVKVTKPIGSLDAIDIGAGQISFQTETNKKGRLQLRAIITERDARYNFSVPAHAAIVRFRAAGIAGLEDDARRSAKIHVRLGLARPFPDTPDQCYAQVNGLYFL